MRRQAAIETWLKEIADGAVSEEDWQRSDILA